MFVRFYKITSTNTEKIYIGSTRMTLENRLLWHELDYKTFLSCGIKKTMSREVLCEGDYSIHLLEVKLCENKLERYAIEKKYIESNPNAINKLKRLGEYLRLGSKEYAKQYYYTQNNARAKEHYKEHKENILTRAKQIFTCEICNGTYDYSHKSTHLKSKKHRNALII